MVVLFNGFDTPTSQLFSPLVSRSPGLCAGQSWFVLIQFNVNARRYP